MRDFFITLYSNENFPMILGGIIVILLIAFFVVFFLGKKDQKKIEATQRLEKLKTADGFKEVSVEETVEIKLPKLNSAHSPFEMTGTLELPKMDAAKSPFELTREIEMPKMDAAKSPFELTSEMEIPRLDKIEEVHLPLTVDLEDFAKLENDIDLEQMKMASVKKLEEYKENRFEQTKMKPEEILDLMPNKTPEILSNSETTFEEVASSEEELLDFMPTPKSVYDDLELDAEIELPRLK